MLWMLQGNSKLIFTSLSNLKVLLYLAIMYILLIGFSLMMPLTNRNWWMLSTCKQSISIWHQSLVYTNRALKSRAFMWISCSCVAAPVTTCQMWRGRTGVHNVIIIAPTISWQRPSYTAPFPIIQVLLREYLLSQTLFSWNTSCL